MLYTLLKDNRIVVGPRDWNPKYFDYFLQQECGIRTTLPDAPIVEPLIFSDIVKLVPTIQQELPQINPNFEVLAGPNFKFDEAGNHIAYYVAQELLIETAKNNLLNIVANNRWIKETTPTAFEISGTTVSLYTDSGSRIAYSQALLNADETYSAQWKFPEGFITLTKSDLQIVVKTVVDYVQTCFDWEASKHNEINSKSTIEELKQIILE